MLLAGGFIQRAQFHAKQRFRLLRGFRFRLLLRRLAHLLGLFQPAEGHLDLQRLAVAHDLHDHFRADRRLGDDAWQIPHLLHLHAIELHNDVPRTQARPVGRTALRDIRHQGAHGLLEPQPLGQVLGHRLNAHAQPAAARLTIFHQLRHHLFRQVGGNGETDAHRTAGRRQDGGVHTHDLALHVEQRAAGIALVDGRVRLDEIVVGTGIDVAVAGRNDAQCHGSAQPERIADRQHPVADLHPVGIAELNVGQRLLGLDDQHGEIRLRIAPPQSGLQPRAIREIDDDFVGPLDHMVVGDDDALGIDDESRTEGGGATALVLRRHLASASLEELAEFVSERPALAMGIHQRRLALHGRGDVDHRLAQHLRQRSDGTGRLEILHEPVLGLLGPNRGHPRQGSRHETRRHEACRNVQPYHLHAPLLVRPPPDGTGTTAPARALPHLHRGPSAVARRNCRSSGRTRTSAPPPAWNRWSGSAHRPSWTGRRRRSPCPC